MLTERTAGFTLMCPRVLPIPSEPWVDRLRRDHVVWLVKEQRYATVAWAWEPPEPGHRTGRMAFVIKPDYPHGSGIPTAPWFIGPYGEGLDSNPLIAPCEGHLPDEALPISEPVVRDLYRKIAVLVNRVDQLERAQDMRAILRRLSSRD